MIHKKIINLLNNIPKHTIVASSAWGSKIITTIISLVSIRLLLAELGTDNYAVYSVLIGTAGWFMLSDFGISQSIQNYISEARANEKDYDDYIISTATVSVILLLLTIFLLLAIGPLIGNSLLRQFTFLNTKQRSIYFTYEGIIAVGTAFGSIVYKIWYAEQRGYLANTLPTIASAIGLIAIVIISKLNINDKLLWYIVCINSPLALLPISAYILKIKNHVNKNKRIKRAVLNNILKRALKFLLFNLVAAGVLQMDYLILSQFVKTEQIVIYTISSKIFLMAGFIFSAVLQAFWPTCTELVAKKQWDKVKEFSKKYILYSFGFMLLFTSGVILFRNDIYKIFIKDNNIYPSVLIIILFGIVYFIRLWSDLFAVILQSISIVKILLFWASIQAMINFAAQFLLTPIWGVSGVLIGLIISFISTVAWALPRKVLSLAQK